MFENISVGIKTLLRDTKLFRALDGIKKHMRGCQIIVADDGDMTEEKADIYASLIREGHKIIHCPFDSGFGFKSNRIAEALERPYLLVASDDFEFTANVAEGVLRLEDLLNNGPNIDIASGRVNGRPYEFNLTEVDGVVAERIAEEKPFFTFCDLTVNFSLIKREVLEKVRWDDDQKISQGEHGAFFLDVKRAGFRVAYVSGVNINQQEGQDSEEYRALRNRGGNSRSCFEKRGVTKYVLGSGIIDYGV